MARGYPDYFGLPIWPNYGTLKGSILPAGTALPAGDSTIHDLTVKGIVRGGFLELKDASLATLITLKLTIDGAEIYNDTIQFFLDNDLLEAFGALVKLCRYDIAKAAYSLEFTPDIMFGYQYNVVLNMPGAPGNTCYSRLFYADVI